MLASHNDRDRDGCLEAREVRARFLLVGECFFSPGLGGGGGGGGGAAASYDADADGCIDARELAALRAAFHAHGLSRLNKARGVEWNGTRVGLGLGLGMGMQWNGLFDALRAGLP